MTETNLAGPTQEAFEAFLASRLEPRWLTDLRQNAWKTFQELPMPHDLPPGPQQEEWRRTDIRRFHLEKFPLPSQAMTPASHADVRPLLTLGVELAGQTRASDSRPCESRLDPDLAARGV